MSTDLAFPIGEVAPADVQKTADEATRAALLFVEENKVAVTDLASCERAVATRTAIGEKQKAIIAQLEKPKKWAYGLHRWFCDLENAAMKPYAALDTYERDEIRTFNDEQNRIKQAKERELAEQARQDAEARATAEAAAHERAGDHQMAAAVMEEAIAAPAPVVVLPSVTKGIVKTVRSWHWRFPQGTKEAKSTAPAIVARTMTMIPRDYLCVDEKKLTAYAKTMQGLAKVPGIEFYYTDDPVR